MYNLTSGLNSVKLSKNRIARFFVKIRFFLVFDQFFYINAYFRLNLLLKTLFSVSQ